MESPPSAIKRDVAPQCREQGNSSSPAKRGKERKKKEKTPYACIEGRRGKECYQAILREGQVNAGFKKKKRRGENNLKKKGKQYHTRIIAFALEQHRRGKVKKPLWCWHAKTREWGQTREKGKEERGANHVWIRMGKGGNSMDSAIIPSVEVKKRGGIRNEGKKGGQIYIEKHQVRNRRQKRGAILPMGEEIKKIKIERQEGTERLEPIPKQKN